MKIAINSNKESGQVAIISVMFFMILFSVVVVSFVRAVVVEQRQTTNNELSASALAAAEAGVEDSKRILVYCAKNPNADGCETIEGPNNSDCNSVINSDLSDALSLKTVTVSNSEQVIVAADDNERYQQYYACLIINRRTNDVTQTVTDDGRSAIVPLKLVDASGATQNAAYFTVNWTTKGQKTANVSGLGLDDDGFLNIANWKDSGAPPVLRIELVTIPKLSVSPTGFGLEEITQNARAVTLRPGKSYKGGQQSGGSFGANVYDIDFWKTQTEIDFTEPPFLRVDCTQNSNRCSASLRPGATGGLNLANNDYYLRIQAIYNDADVIIGATDNSGNKLYFDGVQPSVDVTGRANDAYKRLLSRLQSKAINGNSAENWWPEYALESGNKICKDMTIRVEDGQDNCNYSD